MWGMQDLLLQHMTCRQPVRSSQPCWPHFSISCSRKLPSILLFVQIIEMRNVMYIISAPTFFYFIDHSNIHNFQVLIIAKVNHCSLCMFYMSHCELRHYFYKTPNFPIVHWVFCIVSVLLPGCEVLTAQSRSHCAAVPRSTRPVTPDLWTWRQY